MNIKEKRLHIAAAKYILGENTNKKISGKSYKIDTFYELLETSKKLYDLLKEEKDLDNIGKLLNKKRELTIKFKNQTGIEWNL